jgi:hypothetical protein
MSAVIELIGREHRERLAKVLRETWGHLAPEPGRSYRGSILFAASEYGDYPVMPIRAEFDGLPDSPWFYEALCEFVAAQDVEPGVHLFVGTLRDERFSGQVRSVPTGQEASGA